MFAKVVVCEAAAGAEEGPVLFDVSWVEDSRRVAGSRTREVTRWGVMLAMAGIEDVGWDEGWS